jgi:hypothetical protein
MNLFKKEPKKEFQDQVRAILEKGGISDLEMQLLIKKAIKLNIDEIDAELLIIQIKKEIDENKAESDIAPNDGFLISNEELLIRVKRWTNYCTESMINVEIEPFPKIKSETNQVELAVFKIANMVKSANLSQNASKIPIPGASLLTKVGLSVLGLETKGKLTHEEIVNIAEKYLLILEMRSSKDPFLKTKYDEYKCFKNENILKHHSKKKFFNF